MSTLDSGAMADNVARLGLVRSHQAEEGLEDIGSRTAPAVDFLRAMERKGYLTPFQTAKLVRGDVDGYFLGGYRMLYKIASGSFGRVYRADDPSSGRVVAVKVLRQKMSKDKHKIELFMREGKLGMTLHHPNIVEILAVNHESTANQYYIVMEFVEGGNLRDLLYIRKKLPAAEVLRILEDTSAALAHASSKGLTHRDMKLTNVLLSSQGPIKLVDFGLAGEQQVGAGGNMGRVGEDKEKDEVTVDRTVDYAGLEKVTDAPLGDPRSDIFFLGCLAYELVSGRSPLDYPRSMRERMSARRFETIPPLTQEMAPDATPTFLRLIENMMALQPEFRIQTAAQLFERVREARAEASGSNSAGAQKKGQATIFLVESDEKLQDVLRAKLKEEGFRVLIAADPVRAVERFRSSPFDLLIVDAATTGENGYYVFEKIMDDAQRQNVACKGILMLNNDQSAWKERIAEFPAATTLMQPVKYKQLLQAIRSQLGESADD